VLEATSTRLLAWADSGWLLTYVVVAAAALHPTMTSVAAIAPAQPRHMTHRRFALLVSASLLAPGLLGLQGLLDPGRIDWAGLTVGSVALFLLVLARMWALILTVQDQARQLESLARHDALTGVLNRRAWDDDLARELARAARTGRPLHVGLVDLDHFKRFNDLHGHPAGDTLLRAAAAAWRENLRTGDVLARYGGEEFAVILTGTSTDLAAAVIDRMRAATPGGQTFSAGIARWNGTESASTLVGRADHALYEAKRAGRNRTQVAGRAPETGADEPPVPTSTAGVSAAAGPG
jgi:diguanylate cyclase (GGDEF)-like protein